MKVTKCRGCGAEIVWAKTVNDKNIPLDHPPEKRFMIEEKSGWVDDPDAGQNRVRNVTTSVAHMHDTYMPHHATCPDVDKFRR